LLCWPFFWLSLAFLIYLFIGALNPAAHIVRDERGWWVEAITPPLASWLPTSVQANYQPMNAWRMLAVFGAAYSLVWGLWAGLSRRAPLLLVLWCFLTSGAAMGLVGILQHLTDAKAVLWSVPSSNPNFWGSFFYRNQGVAYLNLILVLSACLFFYHGVKTREKLRSGGPHFLCILLFALIAASVGLALSRGGILFAAVITTAFLGLLSIFLLQGLAHIRSFWLTLIPVIIISVGVLITVRSIDIDAIENRFGDIESTLNELDRNDRVITSRATWDMAQARLTLGWGAGSFRYIFPMYQQNYPEIFYSSWLRWKGETGRVLYRYAHNDILQFIAEYGLVGSGLVFGALLALLVQAVYYSGRHNLAVLALLVGTGQAFGHAFIDFIFNSPAYWMAFVALLALITQLLKFEAGRRKTRSGKV
jgi:O-antigen ligase